MQYGMLSPLIGAMSTESGLSGPEIGWVLTALMIGSAVSVGLTARLGDTHGHRKVLLTLIILALAGCALAATGDGFWPLAVGRFLMGVAVAIPLTWGLLRPRATASQVQRVSIALATLMAVFTPVALVLGGFMVELGLPWQSVFWASFVMYAMLLVLALVSHETPTASLARVPLDWFGVLGLGAWVTALLIGISEGPSKGWTSPLVLGSFIVSAVVLAVWIVQQRRTQAPVMSFQNMDVRQTLIGYSGIVLVSVLGQAIYLVLPALLQTPTSSGFGLGLSTLESTYAMIAVIPGAALSYFWTGWGLKRLGPKILMIISGGGGIVVFLGLAFAHDVVWMAWLWTFLYGATVMSCWNIGYALVAAAGRQDNMAATFGVQNILQYVAAAIPVAIVMNVLTPGADGFIPEGTFVGIYVSFALLVAVFLGVWVAFAPARIGDRHAIDAKIDSKTAQLAAR
jgi:MFS family permease